MLVSVLQQSIGFWHCRHSRARNTPFATTCIKVWDTFTHTKHLTQCCWHTVVVVLGGSLLLFVQWGCRLCCPLKQQQPVFVCGSKYCASLLSGHCGKCFNRCAYIHEGLATHILGFPYGNIHHTHSLTINRSCTPQPQHHNHTTCQARVHLGEGVQWVAFTGVCSGVWLNRDCVLYASWARRQNSRGCWQAPNCKVVTHRAAHRVSSVLPCIAPSTPSN